MIEVTLPQLGESVTEGTVQKWLVREGDVVQKDQPLLEIATDKADAEVPSPAAGRVVKLAFKEGDVVPVKAVLAVLDTDITTPALPLLPKPEQDDEKKRAKATPAARQAARDQGIDIDAVKGTGDGGRITKEDVLKAQPPPPPSVRPVVTQQIAQMIQQGGGFMPPTPHVGFGSFKVPPFKPQPGDQIVPFTRRRRITADHMVYSKVTSPHVVTVAEVDLHKASKLREANKDRYKKEGLSLTMLAFVVVATSKALRETPNLNARVLEESFVIFK